MDNQQSNEKYEQALAVAYEKGVCEYPEKLSSDDLYALLEQYKFEWREELEEWATEVFYFSTHAEYDPELAILFPDQTVVTDEHMTGILFCCNRYGVDFSTFFERVARSGDIYTDEALERGQLIKSLDRIFNYSEPV